MPNLFFPQNQAEFEEMIAAAVRKALDEKRENNHSAPTELLTAEQLAKKFNLTTDFVYEQAQKGEIPVHRIGEKYIRFDPEEVFEHWRKQRGKK